MELGLFCGTHKEVSFSPLTCCTIRIMFHLSFNMLCIHTYIIYDIWKKSNIDIHIYKYIHLLFEYCIYIHTSWSLKSGRIWNSPFQPSEVTSILAGLGEKGIQNEDMKVERCCWWFRNPARKPPGVYKSLANNEIKYQDILLMQDFFSQQYHPRGCWQLRGGVEIPSN